VLVADAIPTRILPFRARVSSSKDRFAHTYGKECGHARIPIGNGGRSPGACNVGAACFSGAALRFASVWACLLVCFLLMLFLYLYCTCGATSAPTGAAPSAVCYLMRDRAVLVLVLILGLPIVLEVLLLS
jgi:hypothetical protein